MKRILITLLLITSLPAHAENGTDTTLKNTAIAGTLLSWGITWLFSDVSLEYAARPGRTQHLSMLAGLASQSYLSQFTYGRDFATTLIERGSWQLKGQWELDAALWLADNYHRANSNGWIIGVTPVLQYQLKTAFRPYVEFGIGLKYLSDIRIADQYKSTQFQFGDLAGIGIQYRSLQLGFRFLHISNASIETPNPGTNYYTIKVDYLF